MWNEDTTDLGWGEFVTETSHAILVNLDDYGEQWIPKSQISPLSDLKGSLEPGTCGNLEVSEWWAQQKGWA